MLKTNDELVEYLINYRRVLKTPSIIDAFKSIDRIDFINKRDKEKAYEDHPLPIAHYQTISQPYTVAFMLELLQAKEESVILDVGCGSCYTTALLAKIANKGKVIGVEIIQELIEFCKNNLKKYNFENIEIYNADKIPPNEGEFDRILVSASATSLPEELIDVLKENGRMVIPINSSIFLIQKIDGQILKEEFYGFAFVPLK